MRYTTPVCLSLQCPCTINSKMEIVRWYERYWRQEWQAEQFWGRAAYHVNMGALTCRLFLSPCTHDLIDGSRNSADFPHAQRKWAKMTQNFFKFVGRYISNIIDRNRKCDQTGEPTFTSLTQYQRVTDRQMDGRTDGQTRYSNIGLSRAADARQHCSENLYFKGNITAVRFRT